MTFAATLDSQTNPTTLKITSDFRVQQGTVEADSAGQTTSTTYTNVAPLTIKDSLGTNWKLVSDNGATAVYNVAPAGS